MKKIVLAFVSVSLFCGCTDEIPMVNLGIDDVYYIARMQKLDFHPALTGERYEWYVDGVLVSEERDYIFLSGEEGDYNVELKIIDPQTPYDLSLIHI